MSFAGCVIAARFGTAQSVAQRVSIATAYTSLALLAVTLAIGPFARMTVGRYPLSTHLRRDIGVWAGILALSHVVAALQVHADGHVLDYFIWPRETTYAGIIRFDPFGIANYLGAAATGALAVLLVTSNDRLLRELGAGRWRMVHRIAYPAAVVVIVHGLLYAILERRAPALLVMFAAMSVTTVGMRFVARGRNESGVASAAPTSKVMARRHRQ